ncbi:hypothetical protein SLEP1_g24491 [Rubroshorea leprosula]|uniref:Peptidase A1 domain-containing protein n=1 Tax=Rubroshorea leprosula TaxID=152421 RepID=A0AAV5JG47_9ROSI|nr:hypothetical protein SLEP1_g24491 [Rubroshorea leprosula]
MAASVNHQSLLSFLSVTIIIFILGLTGFSFTRAQTRGFSAELIHRDSPKSPFYNPSEVHSERLSKAFHRSIARVSHFKSPPVFSKNLPESNVMYGGGGEYIMNISIGTPSVEIVAIADTGSDLIWTQCKPCSQCIRSNAPLFDPDASSTYKPLSCFSFLCKIIEPSTARTSCPAKPGDNTCLYSYGYGSGFSSGDLATETLTLSSELGSPVILRKTYIGCGRDDRGTFNPVESGIIGLGGGALSLVSQLGTSIAGKFSYCLVPSYAKPNTSSKIHFGKNAVVSGLSVVSTPLLKKYPQARNTFYILNLQAISVDDLRINFTGSIIETTLEGNFIIIDSGTPLTILPSAFYTKLESLVAGKIRAKQVSDPNQDFNLCYEIKSDFKVPRITVHFDGADVDLAPLNAFISVSEKVLCFAFAPDDGGMAIYGNIAQTNFLIGYDTVKQTLSFKPSDCSTQ